MIVQVVRNHPEHATYGLLAELRVVEPDRYLLLSQLVDNAHQCCLAVLGGQNRLFERRQLDAG